MWDNHEFSWKGWQTQQNFGEGVVPAQTRKVAACQAWFEYQPARAIRAGSAGTDQYTPPAVKDAAIHNLDDAGLGLEPGNLAAIDSLKLYRTLRWGRNVELILTDNRSFRSEPLVDREEFAPFRPKGFPVGTPADILEILDAGRTYNGGHPPGPAPPSCRGRRRLHPRGIFQPGRRPPHGPDLDTIDFAARPPGGPLWGPLGPRFPIHARIRLPNPCWEPNRRLGS